MKVDSHCQREKDSPRSTVL